MNEAALRRFRERWGPLAKEKAAAAPPLQPWQLDRLAVLLAPVRFQPRRAQADERPELDAGEAAH